ncbi:GNAT family N-acetyltransferase [Paenarthrobacter ureafaciens]|jgi:ribosomal protein S18 acetylase RimI-like enzyme|uniref:GNAT family N-acetyltransferase n=1 Tax=Paenarthrobacter ureafaciens TaxID=37931 RepID=UPI0014098BF8|nr:GNAT family N-acetyltransferase [Paenarthrobacter ureafaciens]MCX8455306.1 GNAT family N-acetyltransferase [Paenarthrobacter ureafaciens]MCY0974033.1 GNAT family N-acetyltransferase [Paenarthrobacter ureafaciens]QQQ63855.1 GNAT family N-acetyltransferase [Paenarthrobacter ureafaciens]
MPEETPPQTVPNQQLAADAFPDPAATGLRWEPASAAHLETWAALIARTAAVEHPSWFEKPGDLVHILESTTNEARTHTLIGLDTEGVARAYGRITKNPEGDKAAGMGCVDPEWQRRGIGTAVIAWQEAQTRKRFDRDKAAGHAIGRPRLRIRTEEQHSHQARLLENLGYGTVRWFNEMHRPLSQPLPDVPVPPGFEFKVLEPALFESVRMAHNEAFQDHWGSEPRDKESWHFTMHEPTARHDWSGVILDAATGEVAAYQLASYDPDAAKDRGFKEGYTELLGVRRAYRGKGLAQALLAEAMRRFTGAGMDVASLDVDSANPTGALALYAGMGYAPVNRSMTWEKQL